MGVGAGKGAATGGGYGGGAAAASWHIGEKEILLVKLMKGWCWC